MNFETPEDVIREDRRRGKGSCQHRLAVPTVVINSYRARFNAAAKRTYNLEYKYVTWGIDDKTGTIAFTLSDKHGRQCNLETATSGVYVSVPLRFKQEFQGKYTLKQEGDIIVLIPYEENCYMVEAEELASVIMTFAKKNDIKIATDIPVLDLAQDIIWAGYRKREVEE